MKFEEFKELMEGMGSIFNKDYKGGELTILYRFFKGYRPKDFVDAIDACITTLDRLPSVHQLLEQCERCRMANQLRETYAKMPPPTEQDKKEFQEILNSFK